MRTSSKQALKPSLQCNPSTHTAVPGRETPQEHQKHANKQTNNDKQPHAVTRAVLVSRVLPFTRPKTSEQLLEQWSPVRGQRGRKKEYTADQVFVLVCEARLRVKKIQKDRDRLTPKHTKHTEENALCSAGIQALSYLAATAPAGQLLEPLSDVGLLAEKGVKQTTNLPGPLTHYATFGIPPPVKNRP